MSQPHPFGKLRAGSSLPTSRVKGRFDHLRTVTVAVLSFAFLLRVVGQAIQRWMPQGWMPPFEEWQGSAIPYPVLLGAQVVILALLVVVLRWMAQERTMMGRRMSRAVIGAGSVYFGMMAMRLLVGFFWLRESVWFTAWISTSYHLVLASVVLLWGWQQMRVNRCESRRSARRSCG